ncbi:MAG: hypothetical protein M3478_06060 [Planctomycetota bacterium]|nr:hypothetical protein [Planctomycetota bacterium]
MNCLALALSEHLGGLMIVGAATAFYVASRAASDAVSEPASTPAPTRHALAQCVPIACVCGVAVWLDHAEIAVGVIFSTAVAALSLHLGVTIASNGETRPRARRSGRGFDVLVEEHEEVVGATAPAAAIPVRGSRAWAMVLPAGVLALMAGFSGKLTLLHGLLFAIQGLLVMMVWDMRHDGNGPPESKPRMTMGQRAQLALATALALVGAVLAVYGAVRMSDETGIMSTGLIASAALGPLLVLPMIGSASVLASQGQAQTAVGASVVIVLLNLCCLLPLVIAGWHARQHYFPPLPKPAQAVAAPATTQSVADDPTADVEPLSEDDIAPVLGFPIAVWRIDTVLLILLGLMLLPVSLNLWEMRRLEGMLLIVIYAGYLVGTTFLGRRW